MRRSTDSHKSSDQAPSSPPPHNPNIFDDEYALDPVEEDDFLPVADGRRPTGLRSSLDTPDHDSNSPARPPLNSAHSTESTDLRRLASHNSIAKAPPARGSISHDARIPGPYHSRVPSSTLRRHASISSTTSLSTMAASEDPFGDGPSHPYGMYPQHAVARSESVTTSSTHRPSQRPLSPQGPAHPYAMYPQNVIQDEPPMPTVQSTIPVGFPGHNAGYHRQVGPDGEEQDIIGPDGHTEQLPPYSRYPEEGPTKASLAAQESATPIMAPILTMPGQSQDTIPSPISPLSPPEIYPPPILESENRSLPPVATPAAPAVPAASMSDSSLSSSERGCEKQETAESAKGWRSKKVGRVPVVAVVLIVLLLVIIAVVLGAALGTLLAKKQSKSGPGGGGRPHGDKHHDEAAPQVTGPINSLFDATPIPTPTGMAPIPTGVYALPLGIAQESSKSCLTVVDEIAAWSCQMTFAPLLLQINYTTNAEVSRPVAFVGTQSTLTPKGTIQYGVQPPNLGSNTMQLVLDLDFQRYGPAYHFHANYDKVVILNQDEFAAGRYLAQSLQKRRKEDKPPFRHRFQVMPGDTPWYCYWNQTYIEGYIYVENNSTAATFTNFPTAWPSYPLGSFTPTSLPAETAETPIETAAAAPSQVPRNEPEAYSRTGSEPESTPMPGSPGSQGSSESKRFVPYPRIVKIEERRLPHAPQPYCQMMRLLDDFSVVPATDVNDVPIKAWLSEEDPTMEEFLATEPSSTTATVNAIKRHEAQLKERGDPAQACHCQWMFQ